MATVAVADDGGDSGSDGRGGVRPRVIVSEWVGGWLAGAGVWVGGTENLRDMRNGSIERKATILR